MMGDQPSIPQSFLTEWEALTEQVAHLYVARLDVVKKNGWKALVLPAGCPTVDTVLPSGHSELARFLDVNGGEVFLLQPDYGRLERAASTDELGEKLRFFSDDFLVSGANGQLRMLVSDAEAHVVVGEPQALLQFCDGELESITRSVADWLEAHKQYAVDFDVMQRLLSHYETVILQPNP